MFITLEGPDGSGKTTLITRLMSELLNIMPNLEYVLTREPGGKGLKEAEKIREIILDKESNLSGVAEAMLYSTSRRIHLEKIIWPALKDDKLVLCDRYVDSFYAYQGYARNLGIDFVKNLTNLIIDNTMPDITIFLNITPQQSKKRLKTQRLIQDRMDTETVEFHQKVYDAYQKLISSDPDRFIIVNAANTIDEVFEETFKKLLAHPKLKQWLKKKNKELNNAS
ncbi:dTMP kinase [Mycoplasmopsis opalescens]|uniref:dTMP kinase n=1 Tax=Mycoplasmopsis opalescens TaxID=114886 RepID=UPI0004A6B443|nr:dTMP kinase [Mycoplasmopsis opalescens]